MALASEISHAENGTHGLVSAEMHHQRFDWIALLDANGNIDESHGNIEGRVILGTEWWATVQEGYARHRLDGGAAGPLLEAQVALIEENSYIVAVPIVDADGRFIAYLAGGISSFFNEFLNSISTVIELESEIVSREGVPIAASSTMLDAGEHDTDIALNIDGSSSTRVTDANGETYIHTTIAKPLGSSRDIQLVTHYHLGTYHRMVDLLSRSVLEAISICSVLILLAVYVFGTLFLRPFNKLASSAQAVMEGDQHYPYENNSTAEASLISRAVAAMQSLREGL